MWMDICRRSLIVAAASTPILLLPGCAGGPGFSLVDAIRRLLGLASQRAFASLLRENGFLDDSVARISLPDALGGERATSIVSAVLTSGAFRSRLSKQLNRAAVKGAELAAPIVADAVTNLGIEDSARIVAGGGSAATDLLKAAMGNALIEKMLPGIDGGLRLFDSPVVTEALRQVTSIDFAGLRDDVTRKASDGIYKAIGREEIAIRADPASTNDPLLIGVFGIVKRS
jgi:Protein of unknown function (DUF4197)